MKIQKERKSMVSEPVLFLSSPSLQLSSWTLHPDCFSQEPRAPTWGQGISVSYSILSTLLPKLSFGQVSLRSRDSLLPSS